MKVRSPVWLARRLTALAIAAGLLSTLSYGTGAHIVLRFLDPPLGAWWQSNEFWIMEGAAVILGWLVGIRIGVRLLADDALRNRIAGVSILVGALAMPWASPACAALARLGWNAGGASLQNRIIGRFGYGAGMLLDKLLIASVYFLKTSGFALLLGLVAFGLILAAFFATVRSDQTVPGPAVGG